MILRRKNNSTINKFHLIIFPNDSTLRPEVVSRKKTFCIIGPTDATLPRFKSMTKIISDIYDKSREVGLNRCGDNFVQNDSEVKTISVSKVYDTIVKNM